MVQAIFSLFNGFGVFGLVLTIWFILSFGGMFVNIVVSIIDVTKDIFLRWL